MKKVLKVKLRHPHKRFRLGRHMVTHLPTEYDLNEDELKELKGKGPQKWIVECAKAVAPKKVSKSKPAKKTKED